jgi:hypothetical protein
MVQLTTATKLTTKINTLTSPSSPSVSSDGLKAGSDVGQMVKAVLGGREKRGPAWTAHTYTKTERERERETERQRDL